MSEASTIELRNVAIIAHVDHGKTTLVDGLLRQSGMFREGELDKLAGGRLDLIMDSNPLERERGITILSKNCAVLYRPPEEQSTYRINLVDTPGHADFGGEVERVLMMADGVLLVVDAFEGPMPQTRFVLQKALEQHLKPIVVINKVDRPDARPDDVVNEVFDLLVELDANDEALDFSVLYASAKNGWAASTLDDPRENLRPLFDTIIRRVPAPNVNPDAPLQMLVTTLDFSEYVGRIAIGRVSGGILRRGQQVGVLHEGKTTKQKVQQLFEFEGLSRRETDSVPAGGICAIVGLENIDIGDTIGDPEDPQALPRIRVDEPTLHTTFRVNDSPFAGKEGQYVTSRQIQARLDKELERNVALRVEPGETPEEFAVSGRGLMHLGVLIENMRREGFELSVGKPRVIFKQIDGKQHEPIELLVVDCPSDCQSAVMALVGDRRAEIAKMDQKPGASGYIHMEFSIPARGLIGMKTRMLNATQGRAIMHHSFLRYEPMRGPIAQRTNGVMIASETGQVTAYALDALYERGEFFVEPGMQVYEGQIVGEHNRDNDIVVNAVKGKQLTNFRTTSKDDASRVKPMRRLSLEAALEYIEDDEIVEVTPEHIRMRKKLLKESDRKRQSRRAASLAAQEV